MGHLKMGAKESRAFWNSWNAYSYSSPKTYFWFIYVNLVKGFIMMLNLLTNLW